jgi:hypothetical protein
VVGDPGGSFPEQIERVPGLGRRHSYGRWSMPWLYEKGEQPHRRCRYGWLRGLIGSLVNGRAARENVGELRRIWGGHGGNSNRRP